MNKKAVNSLKKAWLGIKITTGAAFVYVVGLTGTDYVYNLQSTKFCTSNDAKKNPAVCKKEIESVLDTEKEKLGIKDKKIAFHLEDVIKNGLHGDVYSYSLGSEGYGIVLAGGESTLTMQLLRHELYHIYDGHLAGRPKGALGLLVYLFHDEPKAIWYSIKEEF